MVYLAEGYLPSGLVAIIFSMIIIMNVLFGAIFLKNPIRLHVVLGAVVGLLGLTVVFWPELSSFDFSSERGIGMVLAFISVVSASLGNITSARNQQNGLPIVQTNAFGMAYGAMIMLIIALLRGSKFNFDPSIDYITSLLFLSIFGSVVAFGSYLTLLGRIGPDQVAYITVLFPIIALILSTLFEGITWIAPQFIGVGLVLFGNAITLVNFLELKQQKQLIEPIDG
jgi:drug/metabolite transporter (DMT)-like permease